MKDKAKSQSPLIGAFVPGRYRAMRCQHSYGVSIPSDRGIRSGTVFFCNALKWDKSQSPLIGAFVPGVMPLLKE